MCTQTYNDTEDFKSFGNTIINRCEIDATFFIKKNNYPVYFYEMLIKVKKENNEDEYKEIPVTFDNYDSDPDSLGSIDFLKDKNEKTYFKRFFMIYNNFTDNSILYAKNVTFNVELINSNNAESIMKIPYLRITYQYEQRSNQILYFSFISDYTMDLTKIMNISLAFLIVCAILTIIIIAARMYVWCKLNPAELTGAIGPGRGNYNYLLYFLMHLIFKTFKYYGIIFFFYSWGLSAFWYIFYKLQYRPFVFLPSFFDNYKNHYKKFNIVWGLACNMYGYYMMFRIYEQVNCDVFFIDWEHHKEIEVNVMGKTSSKAYKSPWRSIHIVNQYNLLQKSRTISIPFCFLWLIMLYYSKNLHWNRYAQVTPNISWVEKSPENIILRHFIGTFILFFAGITQYVLVRLLNIWIPTRKTEFLDLCSVANISVLILKDSLRGYYIHGQSPLCVSDTTLQQLIKFLEEEGQGKIKGRGIADDKNDDLQTYEIYLSYSMRQIYDGLFFLPTIQEIDRGNQYDQIQNQAKIRNFLKYIPDSLRTGNIYLMNQFMNKHLKAKIEQATMQSRLLIRDKNMCERFFEFPPSINLTSREVKELVFYKDKGQNFDDVLFIGMELEWLIFVIYVWEMWCIALERYGGSLPISIFMTFVMEQMFYKVRVFFGEKNVAKKAVIDNRFL